MSCHKTLNRGSEGVKKLHTDAQTVWDQVGVLTTSAPTASLCLITHHWRRRQVGLKVSLGEQSQAANIWEEELATVASLCVQWSLLYKHS